MTDWLLDTLVATSGLIVLVLLLREPVRRRFGSRVTYGLWLIPVARLLMPTLTRTVERAVPADASLRLFRPVVGEPLLLPNVTPGEPSLLLRIGGWSTILLAIWLAVAAFLFLSRMIAFHRDRREILKASVEIARVGSIRIIRSPEIASPVAFGIIDRVIALPADFDLRYGVRERRLALEHELAHHQAGDLIANLIAFVLLCLQWMNPLAWIAHTAFRFDQEAACDDRVLDKVTADDRADYGRTIAKAASGRALLFASALDQPHSSHRRLRSMLRNPSPRRRTAGRLLVGTAIAVALPLTASRAVNYVDVPGSAAPHAVAAPVAHSVPAAIPAALALAQPAAAEPVARPIVKADDNPDSLTISGDLITIDGKTKRWEELTPSEKERVRHAVAEARAGLAKVHLDRDRIMRDVAGAAARIDEADLQRNIARAQTNVAAAMRSLDQNGEDLRRWGIDTQQLKASVGESMNSVQTIDVKAIHDALAALDPQKIAASLDGADESIRKAQAELDRLDARMKADKQ